MYAQLFIKDLKRPITEKPRGNVRSMSGATEIIPPSGFRRGTNRQATQQDTQRTRRLLRMSLTMRLSDAGLRQRPTKLIYPNHRLSPATRDRSNRLVGS
jgi:hypothetical protein